MKRWWVSWHALEKAGFTYHGPWWISGYSAEDFPIFCAAVRAETALDARLVIKRAHDRGVDLGWRFTFRVRR